mmetsp:Transcript_69067/g.202194  ORF Transcript_69067/g.202194 Transcript_69067/m.202194 type:complete len:208 (+) Transcript_69067:116-739(+)
MKGVSNEASNTDMMRQHQMSKTKVTGDGLKHEDVDLMVCTDLIDQSRTTVLNGCSDHATILEVLAPNPDDNKALVSDVDPQLLMKVFFKEKVNLSAVTVRFSRPPQRKEDEEEDEETYAKPRLVKLFVNMEDMDFGDVDSAEPKGEGVIESAESTEVKISCIGHKFQRLESLQILIEEAADPEATRSFVNRICIQGHQAQSYHAEYM